jgi:hypothetical protein
MNLTSSYMLFELIRLVMVSNLWFDGMYHQVVRHLVSDARQPPLWGVGLTNVYLLY